MAWGDPGGPSSGDMGSGNFGGMDGHGSFGGAIASQGSGRGYGGGHQSGSTGGGQPGLGMEGGVNQAAIDAAKSAAGFDAAADAATDSFGGWASQVDTQMGPENVGYQDNSRQAMDRATAPQISDQAMQSAFEVGGLVDLNNQAARPGTAANLATGLLSSANPALGLAARGYQTHSAAQNAQSMTQATNEAFGTNVDHSYGNALGAQARGSIAGMVGGQLGGAGGAAVGAMSGSPAGAMAGAVAGAAGMGGYLSDAAKGSGSSVTDSRTNNDHQPINPRDNANLTSATDIARAREEAEAQQQAEQQTMLIGRSDNQWYSYEPGAQTFDSLADATTRIFS